MYEPLNIALGLLLFAIGILWYNHDSKPSLTCKNCSFFKNGTCHFYGEPVGANNTQCKAFK